jgi:adenylate kinase family enzyme
MKRVAVVGCPGVGKTVFVRRLAQKTGLPVIHLDFYYHQKKYDYYNDKPAWIKRVKELIAQDKWIMDGNYSSSFEPRFKRADTIVFLDYPRRVALVGTIKRRVKYHKKLREDMPSDWKEKADLTFLKYIWSYKGESRSKVLAAIASNPSKEVIIFKNRKQAESYLKELQVL